MEWVRSSIAEEVRRFESGQYAGPICDFLSPQISSSSDVSAFLCFLKRLRLASRGFVVRCPTAPGLYFAGAVAEYRGTAYSLTGLGQSPFLALLRLASELGETDAVHALGQPAEACRSDWQDCGWFVAGTSGRPEPVPANEAAGIRDLAPDTREGWAAHPDFEEALLASVLEVIERDATALWWFGGASPSSVKLSEDSARSMVKYCQSLRRDQSGAEPLFLDMTQQIGVPTIGAFSWDETVGSCAWGFAAHIDALRAAKSAFRELCQIETGRKLIDLKESQDGPQSLSEGDKVHLSTAQILTNKKLKVFQPIGKNADKLIDETKVDGIADTLGMLNAVLKNSRVTWYWQHVRNAALGLEVVRSVVPGLQPMTLKTRTQRLLDCISRTGGPEEQIKEQVLI